MRKAKQKTLVNVPKFDQVTTIESAEVQISVAKDTVCRKVKQQLSIKEAKKEADAAYNEQLKILAEEIDTEISILSGWESRKIQIAAAPDLAGKQMEPEVDISPPVNVASASSSVIVPMPSTPYRAPFIAQ